MNQDPHIDLSVLIPFYNEAGNISPVLSEVCEKLDGLAFEIVCVNDGSDDKTAEELIAFAAEHDADIRIFHHVKRSGKSAALFSGLKHVRGKWVQLLDGDGQNDPADTRRIWDEIILEGISDKIGIIAGKRNSRNDSGFKWLQSRVANGIRRFALNDSATDTGCGFKLIRTDAFLDLPFFASMHRFFPALVKRAGWEVQEELVNDRPRIAGQSKYGFLGRAGAGFVDLLGMIWLMRRGGYGETGTIIDPDYKVSAKDSTRRISD